MNASGRPALQSPAGPRASLGSVVARILLHGGLLLIAVGCLAAYEHFKVRGQSDASLASLVAAAGFGFAPVRDVVRVVFGVEGKALHLVHVLGGLGLVALPWPGVVPGAPVPTHAALAPFAVMGAAQAIMQVLRILVGWQRQAEGCRKFVDFELVFPLRGAARSRQIGGAGCQCFPKHQNTAAGVLGRDGRNVRMALQAGGDDLTRGERGRSVRRLMRCRAVVWGRWLQRLVGEREGRLQSNVG
jgi:hypothetical protein